MPGPTAAIAVFVSAHGFGHAGRACAVMDSVHRRLPGARFEIFTTVPRWFFSDSLRAPFAHHPVLTDVGLVQRTSLHEDLQATADRLDEVAPQASICAQDLARRLRRLGCCLVVCDISPLGLAAAHEADLPGVLVENFTWDWIYAGYAVACPDLERHGAAISSLVNQADLHIQATPACRRVPAATVVPPISRQPRLPRNELRARLGVPPEAPLVLLTMGGVPWSYDALDELSHHAGATFVVPGGRPAAPSSGRLITLDHRSAHYHPDLVGAADVVVGKLGYSTLAEVYHSGAVYAFVPRSRFPESAPLTRFVLEEMPSAEICEGELVTNGWLDRLDELLALVRPKPPRPNGAEAAAEAIVGMLGEGGAYP